MDENAFLALMRKARAHPYLEEVPTIGTDISGTAARLPERTPCTDAEHRPRPRFADVGVDKASQERGRGDLDGLRPRCLRRGQPLDESVTRSGIRMAEFVVAIRAEQIDPLPALGSRASWPNSFLFPCLRAAHPPTPCAACGGYSARDCGIRGCPAVPENVVLIHEGDQGDSLFIVVSGKVKVFSSSAAGKEVVIGFHGPGEYVGEMSLDGAPRSASVVTVEPTTCAVVSRAQFRDFVLAHPECALHLIEQLIKRLWATTEDVNSLALSDVYGRLAGCSCRWRRSAMELVIPEKLTQQDIAERIGVSRDMISRLMKDLSEAAISPSRIVPSAS